MALKTERFYYVGKNFTTAMTVQARIDRNGVNVASGVALTEVSAANQPGVYMLTLSPATLSGYGGSGIYEFYIDSITAGQSAPAVTKKWILDTDAEDLDAKLDTIDTVVDGLATDLTALDGKIDVIDGNVDDIETELGDGTYGLSALKTLIDSDVSDLVKVSRVVNESPELFMNDRESKLVLTNQQIFLIVRALEDVPLLFLALQESMERRDYAERKRHVEREAAINQTAKAAIDLGRAKRAAVNLREDIRGLHNICQDHNAMIDFFCKKTGASRLGMEKAFADHKRQEAKKNGGSKTEENSQDTRDGAASQPRERKPEASRTPPGGDLPAA